MNKLIYSSFLIVFMGISSLVPFFMSAQNHTLPLNQSFEFNLNKKILESGEIIHSSFKPILEREVVTGEEELQIISPSLYFTREKSRSLASRKFFHEHFISLDTGIIQLTIDPLFNIELGKELRDDPRGINLYKNTRGFNIKLSIGEKIAIESSFRENQANLPLYLSRRIALTNVAYGQGRVKEFKENGFDFAMASSYLSYSPSDRVNIQAGHGKHFIGQGHRSILLSDLAFNYPFLKINSNWFEKKVQYQNLYTVFQDLYRLESSGGAEALFARKQGAFHYLEYNPTSKLSFALFEGVIFPSLDTTGNINVGANFWIPLIFLNTLIEGGKRPGNTTVGTNISYHLNSKIMLYHQFAVKDEKFSQYAFQLGSKWFIHKNFMLQGEFNSTAKTNTLSLFNHYNESLSTPYVSDNKEVVGILHYKKDRWLSRAIVNYNINEFSDIQFIDARQSYVVNPSFNFTVHIGAQMREQQQKAAYPIPLTYDPVSSFYVYFGLSTNLQNIYFNY